MLMDNKKSNLSISSNKNSLTGIRGCAHHSQPANMAVTDGNNTKRIQPKNILCGVSR